MIRSSAELLRLSDSINSAKMWALENEYGSHILIQIFHGGTYDLQKPPLIKRTFEVRMNVSGVFDRGWVLKLCWCSRSICGPRMGPVVRLVVVRCSRGARVTNPSLPF